jgi:hypothetical protein
LNARFPKAFLDLSRSIMPARMAGIGASFSLPLAAAKAR